ncbi:MAG: molybdenum ABC transporter ATP-binding protein [Alphaproteobacteria bacterium]|nr:molybdenum ABC transporter ATP-binding protein [Alphaproteobacteria bacterium]
MIEVAISLARPGFALDVTFHAGSGITALFGPSGAGKTTLLDCIAGLVRPERGRIVVDDRVFFDGATGAMLVARHRKVGYVFQDGLLFPHLSVEKNLRYGMGRGGADSEESFQRLVGLLGLASHLGKFPSQLSGGERQRVAFGRAVLSQPSLLLMDEPLAALDEGRKHELLPYIEALSRTYRIPVLYVSHAAGEVARLADDVVVLAEGRVVAQGSPQEVLGRCAGAPESRFERLSVLTANAGAHDEAFGLTTLHHPAGAIAVAGRISAGTSVRLVIRATDVTLASHVPDGLSIRTSLKGEVRSIEADDGAIAMVIVSLEGSQTLAAAATRKAIAALGLAVGQPIWCLVKSVSIDERWLAGA